MCKQIKMDMSANNAKYANKTYKNKGSFALALFADLYPWSEFGERKVGTCVLFLSVTEQQRPLFAYHGMLYRSDSIKRLLRSLIRYAVRALHARPNASRPLIRRRLTSSRQR